jgi:hypothetical protein
MNLISTPRWIMDEWFFNLRIHGILQNIINGTHDPHLPRDEAIMEEISTQLQAE